MVNITFSKSYLNWALPESTFCNNHLGSIIWGTVSGLDPGRAGVPHHPGPCNWGPVRKVNLCSVRLNLGWKSSCGSFGLLGRVRQGRRLGETCYWRQMVQRVNPPRHPGLRPGEHLSWPSLCCERNRHFFWLLGKAVVARAGGGWSHRSCSQEAGRRERRY